MPTIHHSVPPKLDPRRQTLPTPFVVVVTGASRGIGKAIALAFAQAGATGLILTARTVEALRDVEAECKSMAASPELVISLLAADVSLESSALSVLKGVETEHAGRLDLLVNNAGILASDTSAYGKLCDIDSSQIEETMKINHFGRFYMTKHLIPLMIACPSQVKAVVNVSSIGSHVSAPLGYSISALCTNRLAQRVAEAYGDQGVVSYAIHPGAVLNEIPPPGLPAEFYDFSIDSVHLCGAVLVWLVKEKREWLSGRYIDATWDVDELEGMKEDIVKNDKLKMRLVV